MKTRTARWTAVAVAVLMGAAAASGATYSWIGDGTTQTNWFDGANWDQSGNVPGQTAGDQAYIGANVNGTINYTPGTPTTFDYLNIAKTNTVLLTVNVNGNMTTTNGTSANVIGAYVFNKPNPNVIFNVNSGTFTIGNSSGLTLGLKQFNVAPGASVFTHSPGGLLNELSSKLNSGTMTIRGTFCSGSLSDNSAMTYGLAIGGGVRTVEGGDGLPSSLVIDGGTVKLSKLVFGAIAGSECVKGHSAIVTNNGSLTLRYDSSGLFLGGSAVYSPYYYDNFFTLASGAFTNNSAAYIGTHNAYGVTGAGTGTVTMAGGTWKQGGSTYIGDGRVGIMTIGGGTFSCPSDVYVGSGRTNNVAKPTTATSSGTLTINGGTVEIVNPIAGTVYNTAAWGFTSSTHFPGAAVGQWDRTYLHQRFVFDTLNGAGAGLSVGTIYYAGAGRPNSGYLNERYFSVAAVSGGSGLGGTAYTSGSYHTLRARLLVGNTMAFSDGSLDIPGTLTLNGGALTVEEFVANMGAGKSMVNFNGGAFVIRNSSDVDLDTAFVVGNGVAEAALGLGDGSAHAFADGVVINTNAVLAVGGTNAIGAAAMTGNLTLRTGAILDLDFNATTNDWLQVTGTVTLPAQGTLRARALDSAVRKSIPVLQATSIVVTGGSLGQWNRVTVNGLSYGLLVEENQLKLEPPRGSGTVFTIR